MKLRRISDSFFRAPYLPVMAGLILFVSISAANSSHHCSGDGCLGLIIVIGLSALLLAIQLFMCIPIYRFIARRNNQAYGEECVFWVLLSIAFMIIPILFLKGIFQVVMP